MKKHIGTIGHVDHSKTTLTEAINMSINNQDTNVENEYSFKPCIINIDNGGLKMVKGIKNYVGSTVLGYKFILNKNASKKNQLFKENTMIKNTKVNNKVKVLNKRRDYSK